MNCKQIIEKYLKDNGYTGLVNIDFECGCSSEDIEICQYGDFINCEAGYWHQCDKCKIFPDCDFIDILSGINAGCFKKEKPDA